MPPPVALGSGPRLRQGAVRREVVRFTATALTLPDALPQSNVDRMLALARHLDYLEDVAMLTAASAIGGEH